MVPASYGAAYYLAILVDAGQSQPVHVRHLGVVGAQHLA